MYATADQPPNMNMNMYMYTEWCAYPGAWSAYIIILLFSWLVVICFTGCSTGHAWTFVNLAHFAITFYYFHCKKWTPFAPFADDDEGMNDQLTWWEQVDDGRQCTSNRKILTTFPVALYFIACYTTNHENPMLILNTIVVVILVVAKLPIMHRVRLFGINADET